MDGRCSTDCGENERVVKWIFHVFVKCLEVKCSLAVNIRTGGAVSYEANPDLITGALREQPAGITPGGAEARTADALRYLVVTESQALNMSKPRGLTADIVDPKLFNG